MRSVLFYCAMAFVGLHVPFGRRIKKINKTKPTPKLPDENLLDSITKKLEDIGSRLPYLTKDALALANLELGKLRTTLSFSGRQLSTFSAKSQATGDTSSAICACKVGRCSIDERGMRNDRAQELNDGRCCKYTQTTSEWVASAETNCQNIRQKAIDNMIHNAEPAEGYEKSECRSQLQSALFLFGEIFKAETFHGMWVYTAHKAHLLEEILYELFISGTPMQSTSIGSRIFRIQHSVKLLWTGLDQVRRKEWKDFWHAGELSRGNDTDFAKVVEDETVGQLKKCKFENRLPIFWETASGSFANADADKPLMILVGKSSEELKTTAFWNAELPALAHNPPTGDIDIVAMLKAPHCQELMKTIRNRILDLLEGTRSSKRKWADRPNAFRCTEEFEADGHPPTGGASPRGILYPQPGWSAGQLKNASFSAGELRGVGFLAQELRGAGFTLRELRVAGFTAQELIDSSFSLQELRNVGVTARELRGAGFTAKELRDVGYVLQGLRGAGFTAQELRNVGFTLEEVRNAGFTLQEVRNAGFTAKYMRNVGFTLQELRDAGFTTPELRNLGLTAKELMAVFTLKELRDSGFTLQNLRNAGFTPVQLAQGGVSLHELRKAGI